VVLVLVDGSLLLGRGLRPDLTVHLQRTALICLMSVRSGPIGMPSALVPDVLV
jgi:hypothetical protein